MASVALVIAVFLTGLSGSWAATAAVKGVQGRHAAQLMDRYADDVSRAVLDEASRYSDTLTDLAAAVGAQSDLTAGDFTQITSRLNRQRLPGANSVVLAVPATEDQIPRVQAFWRGQGATNLQFAPAGTAREHMFVVFDQPLDGAAPTLGLDLSKAAEPAEAMRIARDSRQVAGSRAHVLLKDRGLPPGQQQMSFLLAAPVHGGVGTPDSGRFRGWVLMRIRGGDFIAQTLAAGSRGSISVALIDGSDRDATPIVAPSARIRHVNALNRRRVISVGQRDWELRVYPTDNLLSEGDQRMPGVTFSIGALIALLLAALIGVLTSTRSRALTKVDQATAALRDDIERRKKIEEALRERDRELQHMAFHDPLTGLANRTLFYQRVEHALVTHNRTRSALAVLYIDLDGFKKVNDERGHSVGDSVLSQVAVRLRACVRGSDTVARLGGDEFAVLAEHMAAPEDAETVADHIVRALQAPFDINGEPANVTASVGVAFRRAGGVATDDIVRSADEAMYIAKLAGKDRYALVGCPSDGGSGTDRA